MYFSSVTTTSAPGCYLVGNRTASGATNSCANPKKSILCTTGKRLDAGIRLTGLRLMPGLSQWSVVHRPLVQLCLVLKHSPQTTCPALSCAEAQSTDHWSCAASTIFIQLLLKPPVHISISFPLIPWSPSSSMAL